MTVGVGMLNRRFVIDTIEDEILDELTRTDEIQAIGMLNTGKTQADVLGWLKARNAELIRGQH